jgi:HK97 gp10 family phage protein
MATGFSFQVQGLDRLLKVFEQLPKQVQKELNAELGFTAKEIRDDAKRDAPADEARLKGSITVTEPKSLTFEVVAQTSYAGYLEFGTKTKTVIPPGLESIASQLKGPSGGHGNPIDALQQWVKRKGIAGTFSVKTRRRLGNKATKEQQDRQAAFIIWQKIRKYGIRPQPYFFKQMEPAEARLRQRLAAIINDLVK